ncbi:MAG: lysozyme inhibitor LprI family protein [Pseudomonadota bacterium]
MRLALIAGGCAVGFGCDVPAASAQDVDCSDWRNGTQLVLNVCSGREYEEVDALLNEQWKRTRSALAADAEQSAMLRDAQRAWITFRDAHCTALTNPNAGGTIRPLIQNTCLTDLTRQRTEQLRAFANGR